ncbi:MAG: DUF2318 domain-containing protein [Thermoplasmata archaeon]|nr:MAG: DUF2318 domain-containing protein [Thermoplasmata archaeon]
MRKEIEQQKKRKQDILTFFGLIIVIGAILAAYFVFSGSSESTLGPESAQNTDVQAGTNQIVIPMTEVDDGEAHFYKYNHNGVEIRYFLLKSSDGVVRAAFDACDVCFREKKGYHQEGDLMVCNNCGQEFESVNINVLQGGCNPAPLDRTYDDNSVTITTDDLAKGAKYF